MLVMQISEELCWDVRFSEDKSDFYFQWRYSDSLNITRPFKDSQ